jgi:hypothetical protein
VKRPEVAARREEGGEVSASCWVSCALWGGSCALWGVDEVGEAG